MIFNPTLNPTQASQLQSQDGFDGVIQAQRVLWSKRILQLWLGLYTVFWGFLTITLTAEGDLLGTAMLALALAFASSFIVTLFFIIPHMTLSRFHAGQVSADEILLAVAFGMGLALIVPGCLYLHLGYSVMLVCVLILFQGLILMSRYSAFKIKITGGDTPSIFPSFSPSHK